APRARGVVSPGVRCAGPAEFHGEVPELREAIPHGQHRRLVIDVYAGRERKRGDRRGVDVDEIPGRVQREQMAAADLAPLAMALLAVAELADLVLALGHPYGFGFPERERVDRAG